MMIVNYSQVSYFNLTAYVDTGTLKYLYFIIIMCLYALIVLSNVFLIMVIWFNRSLHEPMYLFLCSLFVNELYGSTALFPVLLDQILTDVRSVSVTFCFLQIYCLHTYANVQFCSLAVMSYDRYLAICCPLQYHTHMTSKRLALLITTTWLYPILATLILVSLSSSLHLCGTVIDKVYCDNYSVVKLACSDTTVNNIYGLVYTVVAVFGPMIFILYTYMRILQVCFSGSKQTRHKAVSTCTPHLASLLNFSFGCFFEIVQNRFDMKAVPITIRIILSVYFFTCPPLFNPVVYGLNIHKIRTTCQRVLCGKR